MFNKMILRSNQISSLIIKPNLTFHGDILFPEEQQLEKTTDDDEFKAIDLIQNFSDLSTVSHTSNTAVSGNKINGIYVTTEIVWDSNTQCYEVIFGFNNTQRPETWLGNGQNAHVTAFVTCIDMLLSSLSFGGISSVWDDLCNLGLNILSGNESIIQIFENAMKDLRPIYKSGEALQLELNITKMLLNNPNLVKQYPNVLFLSKRISSAARYGKIAQSALYIAKLSSVLLQCIQSIKYGCFYHIGRIPVPGSFKSHAHGDDEKKGSYSLFALNYLCRITLLVPTELNYDTSIKIFNSFIYSLSVAEGGLNKIHHICRYGFKFLNYDYVSIENKINLLKTYINKSKEFPEQKVQTLLNCITCILIPWRDEILLNRQNKVAEAVGLLIDFDQTIAFDLNKANCFATSESNALPKNSTKRSDLQMKHAKSENMFPNRFHRFFQDKNILIIYRQDARLLFHALKQHFLFISFAYRFIAHAHKNIDGIVCFGLPEPTVNLFLQNCILINSDWRTVSVGTVDGVKYLTVDIIKSIISESE
jgi:hypothetical protein